MSDPHPHFHRDRHPPGDGPDPGRVDRRVLGLALLVGALLRVIALEHHSLWWDEAWQWEVASAPTFPGLFDRLFNTGITLNPPLSHMISWVFLRFGDADWLLRLPSVVFGVAGIGVIHGLTRRLVDAPTARMTAWVVALSPFHVFYSQEARLYTELILFSALSTWLLLRAVEGGGRWRWVAYAGSLVLAIYTHVYASLGIAAHGLWILFFHRRHLLRFVGAGLATVAAFSPLLTFFLARMGNLQAPHGGAGSSVINLPYTFFAYSVGYSLGPSVAELRMERRLSTLVPDLPVVVPALVVFGIVFLLGVGALSRRLDRPRSALLTMLIVLPILGVFAASYGPSMTYNARYTSMAFPAFMVVMGAGAEAIWRSRKLWVVGAAGLVLWGMALLNHYTDPRYAKEDIRGVVHYWRELDDEAVLLSYNCAHTIDRYLLPGEADRHFPIWWRSETSREIRRVLESTGARDVYVVAARDRLAVETFVHRDFEVLEEREFSGGVRMMRIAPPAIQPEDDESDDHARPDGEMPEGS